MGTNYTQCVHRVRLRPLTPQGSVDDLTVINFEIFQRDPSLGHFRCESTLFDESNPSLLETFTTGVATRNVTESPPPITVSIRFPIAPAPAADGMAAAPAPLTPHAMPAAPAHLVAPYTAYVEVAEPIAPAQPHISTQEARFSDSSDDSLIIDPLRTHRTLRDTTICSPSAKRRLSAEATPTHRQLPQLLLSHWSSLNNSSSDGSNSFLNHSDALIQHHHAFESEPGPLLTPHFSETMPTVDQGTLRVSPARFSHNDDSDGSADSARENSIYIRNSRTTVASDNQQTQSSRANFPQSYDRRPRLTPPDYHEKVIHIKIPSKVRCIPIEEPAVSSSQLTQDQKRDDILDSCQRTRPLQSTS